MRWQIAQGSLACTADHKADGLWMMLTRDGLLSGTLIEGPDIACDPWGIDVACFRASIRAPGGEHRVGLRGEIHELMSGGDWHLSIAPGQIQIGWEALHWAWQELYVPNGLGLIVRPGGLEVGDEIHWACKYRVRGAV